MRVLLVTIFTGLVVCAQDTPKRTSGVNFYSVEKEKALGANLAAEVRRQSTPIDSAVVLDFADKIGHRLAEQVQGTPFAYTFAVVADDPNNPTHEPVALPGGYIFIPAKLILTANDEAEFAGMLAHSMAHAYERHATRIASQSEVANLSTIPLIFMGGWTSYGTGQANGTMVPVGFLKFQRQFETDADGFAITVTSGAGYDPSALVRYVGRVQASEPGTIAKVFGTLPTPEERVASMQTAIQALPPRTVTAPDADEFARIQDEVRRVMRVVEPRVRPVLKRPN